jgi:hypothetical protein
MNWIFNELGGCLDMMIYYMMGLGMMRFGKKDTNKIFYGSVSRVSIFSLNYEIDCSSHIVYRHDIKSLAKATNPS